MFSCIEKEKKPVQFIDFTVQAPRGMNEFFISIKSLDSKKKKKEKKDLP